MGMSLFWFLQVPLLFLTLFLHYAPSVLFPVDAALCSHTLLHSIPYSSLLIAKKSSISWSAIAPSHALSMSLQLLHVVEMLKPFPPAFNLQLSVPSDVLLFGALLAGGLSAVQNKSKLYYIGHHFVYLEEMTSRLSTS